MTDISRSNGRAMGRWTLFFGFNAVVWLLAAVVLHPTVLGLLLTSDGNIDSTTAVSILRWASALAALVGGLALPLTPAHWRGRLRRWIAAHRRGLTWGALAGFILVLVAGASLNARLNHVDVLGALSDEYPIAEQIRSTSEASGEAQALIELAEYFQERPALYPPSRSVLLWNASDTELREGAERFLNGEVRLSSGPYSWRPGERIRWWRPAPEGALFWLHRQSVLFEACEGRRLGAPVEVLDVAAAYVAEWQRGNPPWPRLSYHAWNDDTSANRIMAHIQLMKLRRAEGRTDLGEELAHVESLVVHGQELMREEHHNFLTNHGMMQNAALLTLAAEYPELDRSRRWRDTAVLRMREHAAQHVTEAGVFTELTTGYHDYATRMFLWFMMRSQEMGVPADEAYNERVRKMVGFIGDIRLPDGSYPVISDTDNQIHPPSMPGWPWEDLPKWPEVQVLREAAAAESGSSERLVRLWPEAGYFLLRDPGTSSGGPVVLTMMVGEPAVAHFQPDKLSLTLFGNGRHLLTGPGAQPYSTRPYTISTPQQTALSVDGGSQRSGAVDVLIRDFPAPGESSRKLVLQGRSRLYEGVEHRRTVLRGPEPGSVLLVDEASSGEGHDYGLHLRAAQGLTASSAPAGGRWVDEGGGQVLEVKLWRIDKQAGALPVPLRVGENTFQASASHRGEQVTWVWLLQTGSEQAAEVAETLDISEGTIRWSGRSGALQVGLPVAADTIKWAPASAAPPPHDEREIAPAE